MNGNDKCIWYIAKAGQDGGELVGVTRNRRGYDAICPGKGYKYTEKEVYEINFGLIGHTKDEVDAIVGSSMFPR